MGAYDTMWKSMKATGLYRLDGSTAVDRELQTYAAALDPLCDDLKKLKRESFTATAEDYGLRYREVALGILWPGHTAEERRKMIARRRRPERREPRGAGKAACGPRLRRAG